MVLVKRRCPVVSLSKSWVWCVSTVEPEILRIAVPARMKHGARMQSQCLANTPVDSRRCAPGVRGLVRYFCHPKFCLVQTKCRSGTKRCTDQLLLSCGTRRPNRSLTCKPSQVESSCWAAIGAELQLGVCRKRQAIHSSTHSSYFGSK